MRQGQQESVVYIITIRRGTIAVENDLSVMFVTDSKGRHAPTFRQRMKAYAVVAGNQKGISGILRLLYRAAKVETISFFRSPQQAFRTPMEITPEVQELLDAWEKAIDGLQRPPQCGHGVDAIDSSSSRSSESEIKF